MKKIPTFFLRDLDNFKVYDCINPKVKMALSDFNLEYLQIHKKYDGTACLIQNGKIYARFDAKLFYRKNGKRIDKPKLPPEGSIQCSEADSNTGHWPHWRPLNDRQDQWILKAAENSDNLSDGTYEVVGPHFNGNPHQLTKDVLVSHNAPIKNCEFLFRQNNLFETFKQFLADLQYEGIVLYQNEMPVAKLKRKDFGLPKIVYNFP